MDSTANQTRNLTSATVIWYVSVSVFCLTLGLF